jgi:UDP:flavonoid glycosyltransferase YjiC (YdhE family)
MRLHGLAEALLARGHHVSVILRDLQHANLFLRLPGAVVYQAPLAPTYKAAWQPGSYADILAVSGWGDSDRLATHLTAWINLLRAIAPDVVVADHSPSALLAARWLGLRTANWGLGFFVPPRTSPLPVYRDWEHIDVDGVHARENGILACANAAARQIGMPPLANLAQVLAVDHEFLSTWAEFDHYRSRSNTPDYLGPNFRTDQGCPVDWPAGDGLRVLAYLKPEFPWGEQLLQALESIAANAIVAIPGADAAATSTRSRPRLRIVAKAVRLDTLLGQADLVICHAGEGTLAPTLLAGKPVLMLPMTAEQFILSQRVAELGVGTTIAAEQRCPDFAKIIAELGTQSRFRNAAIAFAQRHVGYDSVRQYEQIVVILERLASGNTVA